MSVEQPVEHAIDLSSLLAEWGITVPALSVCGLELDSRRIGPGQAFIAVGGQRQHGLEHARQALERGARAVLYDPEGAPAEPLAALHDPARPAIAVPRLQERLGALADAFYASPSARLDVVGVTGTNGKTSTTHYLSQALSPEHPCAVLGTVGWGWPDRLHASSHTTPDPLSLHRTLAALVGEGARAVAMEVSSHALLQGRVAGVRFRGAVYTNITRDHLDYHGSLESYAAAKLRLLHAEGLTFAAVNLDDGWAGRCIDEAPATFPILGYTRRDAPEQASRCAGLLVVRDVVLRRDGVGFDAEYGGHRARVHAQVIGAFNVENLAASLTALLGLGMDLETAAARLSRVAPVPGRMELFRGERGGATLVVDYAHTPDALDKALTSLRILCPGRLWVVFGCGGERDRGKRPQMGAIAERLADVVVLTDDNPRHERGEDIIQDILQGIRHGQAVRVERDRRRAISAAYAEAAADDWILVAGKGHEMDQQVGDHRFAFSDREVARQVVRADGNHEDAGMGLHQGAFRNRQS